ncbi:unnamed protein product [Leptosia nina]|uniref:CRC domain-containing protein n=1 Tax=Leptosia nina TaxID=320188 RepID=A0AAV1K0F7_9NEOP
MLENFLNEIESNRRFRVDIALESQHNMHDKEVNQILSNCSCPECDSLKCFSIRHSKQNKTCTCSQTSKLCLQNCGIDPERKDIPKTTVNRVNRNVEFQNEVSEHKNLKYTNDSIESEYSDCISIAESQNNIRNEPMIPLKNISDTTAQLSAQVMDVALPDLNESIIKNARYKDSLTELKTAKQDILSKLRDIYKACSCKVCECIPIKSLFNPKDTCSCKPCECSECKLLNRYYGNNIKEKPHSGCPCIRCDRKDCRGIVRKSAVKQKCSCKPCECLKCSESFSTLCDCEPCKCLDCRTKAARLSRNFIVASVDQTTHGNTCDCEAPCECANCVPNYGTAGALQERSTGTVNHSICPCANCLNDSCQTDRANCRCEIQKGIMNKPFRREHQDYDIRNVVIEGRTPTKQTQKNIKYDLPMSNSIQQNFSVAVDVCHCAKEMSKPQYPIFFLPNKMSRNNPCKCYVDKVIHGHKSSECSCSTCDCLDCEYNKNSALESPKTHSLRKLIIECCNEFDSYDFSNYKDIENIIVDANVGGITQRIANNDHSSQAHKENKNEENNEHDHRTLSQTSKNSLKTKKILSTTESSESRAYAASSTLILNRNFDTKLHKADTDLSSANRRKLYYVASLLKEFSLFSDPSNAVLLQKDGENENDDPERLDKSLDSDFLNFQNNYFIRSSTFKYFNALYDENQKSVNISKTSFDYDKIQATIREAQDFSNKLKTTLQTYETANSNFKSVSQRLKFLYDNYFNDNCEFSYNVCCRKNVEPNKPCCVGDTEPLSEDTDILSSILNASIATSKSSNTDETSLKPIFGSHNLLENVECIESYKNVNVQRYEDVFDDMTVSRQPKEVNAKINLTGTPIKHVNKKRHVIKSSKTALKQLISTQKLQRLKSNITTNIEFSYKIVSDKAVSMENISKPQKDEELNTIITIFKDADFYKDAVTDTNQAGIVYNKTENTASVVMSTVPRNEKEEPWNILRKNTYLKNDIENLLLQGKIPLEFELKEVIGIISDEMRRDCGRNECHEADIATKRNCLERSVRSQNNTTLKASFSELRRISDHTVLVKWHIPQNISHVRGYELQVDGRAVQKIFSPKRSMAVVTCLPRCERVLLTILTITNSNDPHHSNTIVYNPRNKII